MKHNMKMLVFGAAFLAVIIALQFYGIGGKYLVWVAILACLGMHFFMHGGHGYDQQHEWHANTTGTATSATSTKKQEKHTNHKSQGGGGCCH